MVSVQTERREAAREFAFVTPLSEGVAALAVIVLSILALVDVVPSVLLGIATIVVGAALLLQGTEMAAEYGRVFSEDGIAGGMQAVGGGITLEFLAGGTGIVLGILSLFAHTAVLAAAALIVFGGTLLLSGGIAARIGLPITATPATNIAAFIARQSAMAAAGAQVFIGIAAIVLGILAFAGTHGQTLNLVGTLAVGAGLLMASVTSATALVGHLAH